MQSRLDIALTPIDEYGARLAVLRVDGRPLLDIIREIETPIATAAGQPSLAGGYSYLNAEEVIYPSRLLLGEPNGPMPEYSTRVPILECECGCPGCWPLLVRVSLTDDAVTWSDFRQPHQDNWIYPDVRFVFDRHQYEDALKVGPLEAAESP